MEVVFVKNSDLLGGFDKTLSYLVEFYGFRILWLSLVARCLYVPQPGLATSQHPHLVRRYRQLTRKTCRLLSLCPFLIPRSHSWYRYTRTHWRLKKQNRLKLLVWATTPLLELHMKAQRAVYMIFKAMLSTVWCKLTAATSICPYSCSGSYSHL